MSGLLVHYDRRPVFPQPANPSSSRAGDGVPHSTERHHARCTWGICAKSTSAPGTGPTIQAAMTGETRCWRSIQTGRVSVASRGQLHADRLCTAAEPGCRFGQHCSGNPTNARQQRRAASGGSGWEGRPVAPHQPGQPERAGGTGPYRRRDQPADRGTAGDGRELGQPASSAQDIPAATPHRSAARLPPLGIAPSDRPSPLPAVVAHLPSGIRSIAPTPSPMTGPPPPSRTTPLGPLPLSWQRPARTRGAGSRYQRV